MDSHIIRRAEALRRGAADHQLQRQCRTGAWRRLRPGRYAPRAEFDALDARERHRLRAVETLRAAASDAVFSHQSAAVLHGLDLWNTPLAVAHLTRSRPTGGRRTRHRHVHSATLRPDEITEVDGLAVTTVARTVADLARTLPFEQAVVVGDHALHASGLTADDLAAVADTIAPHVGRRRVHRVLDQLDGRSESVGESRSRVLMVREQLPVPNCQSNLYGADGNHLGRVDFLFEEFGVVGEFDGRGKYGRLVPDGQVPADVVWAEKKREDAIRATGRQVVRWSWDELETPYVIVRRIRDAFERARLSTQPRGYVEHTPQA
ncbi:type IV toxin-antitoxin system AbiEi family antitoxin domain-containing protein [Prescottella agglutinans]|uniref:type IV toxin-antitoxin system AbiEi family antitoxin domain-containing protein n=1 Tax=Prescottella agglutinans TaxID=1644129 RepID=UPI003BAC51B6